MLKVIIASLFRLKETLKENMISFKSKYAFVDVTNIQNIRNCASYTYKQILLCFIYVSYTVIPQIYTVGG